MLLHGSSFPLPGTPRHREQVLHQEPEQHSIQPADVTVTREGKHILRDVDLRLDDHRIAVIGLNGSGKSTLVRLLNGLVLPTRGTVRVGGTTTAQAPRSHGTVGRSDRRVLQSSRRTGRKAAVPEVERSWTSRACITCPTLVHSSPEYRERSLP